MSLFQNALRRLNGEHGLAVGARFALAGALYTLVGLTIILALDVGLGVPSPLANAAGYAGGFVIAWILQRRFVFRSDQTDWATKGRYAATLALAFALNQAVLWAASHLLGSSSLDRAIGQVAAVVTYTGVQFVIMRAWVFKTRTPA